MLTYPPVHFSLHAPPDNDNENAEAESPALQVGLPELRRITALATPLSVLISRQITKPLLLRSQATIPYLHENWTY
jgi:hypothetical protein